MNENIAKKIAFIEKVSQSLQPNMARLNELMSSDERLRVAVFGKYNHGKSTLLNALIGQDVFKAADKRETLEVSEFESDGIIWIDTPGLDADVHGEDDRKAKEAAFSKADLLCLVHNVKAGELDHSEMGVYSTLMKQCRNYKAKIIVVLTQIDQLDPESLKQVQAVISQQLPDVTMLSVSSVRYSKGVSEGKSKLVEHSNFDALKEYIQALVAEVDQQRRKEAKDIVRKTRAELMEILNHLQAEESTAEFEVRLYRKKFKSDLAEIRRMSGFVPDKDKESSGAISGLYSAGGFFSHPTDSVSVNNMSLSQLRLLRDKFKNQKLYSVLMDSKAGKGGASWLFHC